MNNLIFNNKSLLVVEKDNQIWMSSKELAKALEYKSDKSVTNIFNTNSDEFTGGMTQVIESVTSGNYIKKIRVFSLRGCHLIAMLSRTKIAKDFRKWVLDILDRESKRQVYYPTAVSIPYDGRWLVYCINNKVEIKNIDNKVCLDNDLYIKLQKDSAFYRNQLEDMTKKMQGFLMLTQNYAKRTRITSGECSVSIFDQPLAKLIA